MGMKSSSRLAAAGGGVATSQVIPQADSIASPSGYGTAEERSMMKQSSYMRESSYQGRQLRGSSIGKPA